MKGFTCIPNSILFSGELDPYQLAVYARIAGRVICFESQRNMAKGLNISVGKVNSTMKWLRENGYIQLATDEKAKRSGWSTVCEQVQQNSVSPDEQTHQKGVSPDEHVSPDEQLQQPERSSHDTPVSPDEQVQPQTVSPDEHVSPHERHLNNSSLSLRIREERAHTPAHMRRFADMWSDDPELNEMVKALKGICHGSSNLTEYANELLGLVAPASLERFGEYWREAHPIGSAKENSLPWASQVVTSLEAYLAWLENPTPPQPSKQEMIDHLIALAGKYGRNNYAKAREHMTQRLQAIVKEMGGWYRVCELTLDGIKFGFYESYKKVPA